MHLWAISGSFVLLHNLTRIIILLHSVRITGALFDNPYEISANYLPSDINIIFETGFKPSKDLVIRVDGDRQAAVFEHKKNQTIRWKINPNM